MKLGRFKPSLNDPEKRSAKPLAMESNFIPLISVDAGSSTSVSSNLQKKGQWSHYIFFFMLRLSYPRDNIQSQSSPQASWKAGNPRICPSPRQGPSKPVGTTLSMPRAYWQIQRGTQPRVLLVFFSPGKRKEFTFLSTQLVLESWSGWSHHGQDDPWDPNYVE